MLLEHYKLAVQPFGMTPDPRFLYLSGTHREAMASLLHGIRSGTGFTALIAAPGMGKTTLLFNLLRILKGETKTAFLFQTLCGPREFLNALLVDLGIEDDGKSVTQMHAKLNEYLLRESRNGLPVLVIIDEAQNLQEQVLEVVRMLSNFETADRKLLHVVLAGQPQLAEKLNLGSLTQLRQRISIVARLAPLNARETHEYIEHRLTLAGHVSGEPLFTNQAYAMIAEQSRGIPRDINNLCFNAMSLGCALKRSIVDESMVQETIDDLELGTIVESSKKSDERSGPPSRFNWEMFSSAEWQRKALLATVVLASLITPITLGVLSARKHFLPERAAASTQPGTNYNFDMVAPSGAPVPEAKRARVPRPALVSTTETPRTRTRSDESGKAEQESGARDKLESKVNQNAAASVIVDTAGHDHQRLNGGLEFDSLLQELGLTQQMRANGIPLSQQPARESQSSPEENTAPSEFAAQGVTP